MPLARSLLRAPAHSRTLASRLSVRRSLHVPSLAPRPLPLQPRAYAHFAASLYPRGLFASDDANSPPGSSSRGGSSSDAPGSAGGGDQGDQGDRGDRGDGLGPFQKAIDIVESSAKDKPASSANTMSRPQIPEVYPQLLAIPIAKRPLFPGFYKAVLISDPAVKAAIRDLVRRGQPYVATFLLRDDAADADVIRSADDIYPVGTFAQITNVVSADSPAPTPPDNAIQGMENPLSLSDTARGEGEAEGEGEGPMTVVLYPHRRIRLTALLPHRPSSPPSTPIPSHPDHASTAEAVEENEAEASFYPVSAISTSSPTPTIKVGRDGQVIEPDLDSTHPESEQKQGQGQEMGYPTDFLLHLPPPPVSVVRVENLQEEPFSPHDPLVRAVMQEIVAVFKDIAALNPLFRDQIATFSMRASGSGNAFEDPGKLADFAAAVSAGDSPELQAVLDALSVPDRLQQALFVLKKELMNAQLQGKIRGDVESKIHKRQRDFYLMEQLRSIKKELGLETDGKDKMLEDFRLRASHLRMPEAVAKVFEEELGKLAHLEPSASEFNVTRNYLDWLSLLPWGRRTPENFDLAHASAVLEEDHYGLKDVKDRILEFIAVGKLKGTVQGKIICLVGPPGVGKTSIGKSIARALSREFYRFSVGGLTDVAEIKGHRRTYVGAMPGKVIQALKQVNTDNPLILIDEIDKIGRGHQGDPSSALLELLDPEQNTAFLDHYMDVPVDLSGVLFVCTANLLDTIPAPLLDRMEVIHLSGYVADEKAAIARRYLAPTAKRDAGLEGLPAVSLDDPAIHALIRSYCRESGVRNLKKHIDKIYRKAALSLVRQYLPSNPVKEDTKVGAEGTSTSDTKVNTDPAQEDPKIRSDPVKEDPKGTSDHKSATTATTDLPIVGEKLPEDAALAITEENLADYVGPPIFTSDRLYDITPPGVVMGLAWTSMGGSALYVESILSSPLRSTDSPSSSSSSSEDASSKDASSKDASDHGRLQTTGQMGDVMKESTSIAYTYAKSWMALHHPTNPFFSHASIHLHVPEGATPKDGPSAGITMTSSLLSLALDRPLPPTLAMTGEITLTGKVLKIGGLKEKTIAAKRSGISTILFPEANSPDWSELPANIKEGMTGIPVAWFSDVAPHLGLD